MNKSELGFCLFAMVSCLAIGFLFGFFTAPDGPAETESNNPDLPLNTSANLTLNLLNHGGNKAYATIWIRDDLGQEVAYRRDVPVNHSGKDNLIYFAWDDVSEYDDTIFTITIKTPGLHEVKWRVVMGESSTLVVSLV